MDDLGRIVLPVETRRLFGIHPGDALEIGVAEGAITLRKVERACVFCESGINLREFKGKMVCSDCVGELSPDAPPPADRADRPEHAHAGHLGSVGQSDDSATS